MYAAPDAVATNFADTLQRVFSRNKNWLFYDATFQEISRVTTRIFSQIVAA